MGRGDLYEYKGKMYTEAEITRKFNIGDSTFSARLKRGMTVAEAIETPTHRETDDYKAYKCKPETGLPENWLSLSLDEIKERALRRYEF